jgi:Cu/Ag efflux protein CusF
MRRFLSTAAVGLVLLALPALAQEGIQRGKVKKLDLDAKLITITADGQDRELAITEQTRVLGSQGDTIKERFKDVKKGTPVFFKPEKREGKDVLMGLKLDDGKGGPKVAPTLVKVDSSKFKPLPELSAEEYQGFKGGLYPDGKNERPAEHEKAGLALAKQVRPLDADGKPSPDGKIVLLSVGMSNTSQSSDGFRRQLAGETGKNPKLLFVNGAVGGMTAQATQDPDDKGAGTRYWTTVDERLKAAGVTRAQVQVVWIKQADAGPSQGFPGYARKLQKELANIVRVLHDRFPNVKLVYLSSRTYGGYARTPLNPEPYAYESGFAVKWLIEDQIKGDKDLNFDPAKGAVKAPWLSWGPYLWANGSTKRADGFSYEEKDFANDGTHQSASGQEKVGRLLLQFFKTDATARPWFLAKEAP